MVQALVLNATYEPLSVVPAKRAVVLLVREKAELVESRDRHWSSEKMRIPVPSVIRLRTYVKVPFRRRVPLNRRAVFARDESTCQYCGRTAENIDHVLPRSRGGTHTWENVAAACRPCNTRKGDRTPEEAGMKLARAPRAPRENGWLVIGLAAPPEPSWRVYLAEAG
ncbi:MAG TPA: HNH endonuclease [Acidimicrobiia bacterium]|nr:HNH endonuclease [Acidimicrobiia bacterium]